MGGSRRRCDGHVDTSESVHHRCFPIKDIFISHLLCDRKTSEEVSILLQSPGDYKELETISLILGIIILKVIQFEVLLFIM